MAEIKCCCEGFICACERMCICVNHRHFPLSMPISCICMLRSFLLLKVGIDCDVKCLQALRHMFARIISYFQTK